MKCRLNPKFKKTVGDMILISFVRDMILISLAVAGNAVLALGIICGIGYINVHVFSLDLITGPVSSALEYYLESGFLVIFFTTAGGMLLYITYTIILFLWWVVSHPKEVYHAIIKCDE